MAGVRQIRQIRVVREHLFAGASLRETVGAWAEFSVAGARWLWGQTRRLPVRLWHLLQWCWQAMVEEDTPIVAAPPTRSDPQPVPAVIIPFPIAGGARRDIYEPPQPTTPRRPSPNLYPLAQYLGLNTYAPFDIRRSAATIGRLVLLYELRDQLELGSDAYNDWLDDLAANIADLALEMPARVDAILASMTPLSDADRWQPNAADIADRTTHPNMEAM